jgi:hypothetical protein
LQKVKWVVIQELRSENRERERENVIPAGDESPTNRPGPSMCMDSNAIKENRGIGKLPSLEYHFRPFSFSQEIWLLYMAQGVRWPDARYIKRVYSEVSALEEKAAFAFVKR